MALQHSYVKNVRHQFGETLEDGKNVSYHITETTEKTIGTSYANQNVQQIMGDSDSQIQYEDTDILKCIVRFSNISVQDLPKKDIVGMCDPYVIFRIGDEEKQTSVANNSSNYEYINESIDLEYDPVLMGGNEKVNIEVWDHDRIGKDDLIGVTSVDILKTPNQQVQIEMDLSPKNDEQSGYLGKVIFNMAYLEEKVQTNDQQENIEEIHSIRSQRRTLEEAEQSNVRDAELLSPGNQSSQRRYKRQNKQMLQSEEVNSGNQNGQETQQQQQENRSLKSIKSLESVSSHTSLSNSRKQIQQIIEIDVQSPLGDDVQSYQSFKDNDANDSRQNSNVSTPNGSSTDLLKKKTDDEKEHKFKQSKQYLAEKSQYDNEMKKLEKEKLKKEEEIRRLEEERQRQEDET
ncbi:MAG: hypothetical protein EZS28_037423, partial [Streblomastix strix]